MSDDLYLKNVFEMTLEEKLAIAKELRHRTAFRSGLICKEDNIDFEIFNTVFDRVLILEEENAKLRQRILDVTIA
jgi:hypothetical protein